MPFEEVVSEMACKGAPFDAILAHSTHGGAACGRTEPTEKWCGIM